MKREKGSSTAMIRYTDSLGNIKSGSLKGFFEGWPNPPSSEMHLRILAGSDEVVLAIDEHSKVVGFITAITDGVLCAYIPFMEVVPKHRGQGIGQELMRRMLEKLSGLYMVDTVCDPDKVSFYEQFGMAPGTAMLFRRHEFQSGK
jgi:GNAT superfamily N-acetyltransferase